MTGIYYYMPKVFQCANCKRQMLGGTYTLIKHFEKCIKEIAPDKTIVYTSGKETKNTIKRTGK